MKVSCDCGSFVARLKSFPKNTPGRLVCYCDDCQSFAQKIRRTDVLDKFGGTQVIPAYPKEIEVIQGVDELRCYQLTEHGTFRWATACCNSPIANTRPAFPWAGIFHTAYTNQNPTALSELGEIKSRIHGKYALDGAPYKISEKISLLDMFVVLPFIVKGKILGMGKQSPFFRSDGLTPTSPPEILDRL